MSGETAWVNGTKITGTMTNRGAVTSSLNAGGSYTIPAGYHNGSGKVTANSLSSQTSATAVAADILSGKTAYVKGSKITGTMGTMAGGTYTPSTSKQTISCSGKKMTSNITINAIPSTYIDMGSNGSWTVFNQGTFSGGFGFVPYYLNTSTMQQSNYSVTYENKTESNATNFDSDFNGETKYCVNVIRAIPQALVLNRAVNLTSLSRIRVEWYMYLPRRSSSDFNLLLINKNKQSIYKTFYEDRTSAWSSRSFYVYSFISYDISDYSGEYFIGFQSNSSSVGISQIIFVK